MNKQEIQYKNIVIRNPKSKNWIITNFVFTNGNISGENPEHRTIKLEDDNRFTKDELLFLDNNSPLLTLSKSFYEMMDSEDKDTQEMIKTIFVSMLKEHVKNYTQ